MPLQIVAADSVSGQTITFSATGLPNGLSISSTGLISGTPTTTGTFSTTVTATDGLGATGSASFTWFITSGGGNIITVTNPGSQSATKGVAITNLQINAVDSASGQTLTFSATGLPAGLSISSSGLISGTPTAAGTSSVTVTATDTTGATGSTTFSWTVASSGGNTVTVTNPGDQNNNIGSVIHLQIVASDSAGGQTLTYSASGLPTGLSINSSSGLITGTVGGSVHTYSTVVTATDTTLASGTASFTWSVPSTNVVTVTNPGNQTSQVGQSPTLQIVASDSASGQTLTYTTTGLPNGLTINSSSGFISGTLTATGTSNVTARAIDTVGAAGSASFTWTVNSQPTALQARVGNSIPNQSFATGCYNAAFGPKGANQNQEGADTFFVQNVNRPVGGTHLKVTKKFWNGGNNPGDNGDYHLSGNWNNMQNYANHGTRVIACIQPACPPGLNARDSNGTPCNFTTSSQCTAAQQATCQQEVQNIITFCRALKNMGFTSQTLRIVFYQEPADAGRNGQVNGVKMFPVDYGNVFRTYGPVIQNNSQCFGADGRPYPLISNTNFVGGGPVPNTTDYANAALGRNPAGGNANPPTNVTLLGLAVDFYTNSYYKNNTGPNWQINKTLSTPDSNGESLLTIADTVGIAFGFHEFGDVPLRYDAGGAPWTFNLAYLNYVQSVMVGRINSNKPNLDCIYYQAQCSATGVGDIASPIAQDPGTGSLIGSSPANHYNDFRIAWFQGFYDAVNGN